MKKYNRGVTIVELLISVSIIGMVLLFLFSMLIQVREEDNDNNIQSNFIINQSTFIKTIEEDISNYGVKGISGCSYIDAGVSGDTVVSQDRKNFKCIRFDFDSEFLKDNVGYLIIYNYYTKYDAINKKYDIHSGKWMIKYARGYYKTCDYNGNYTNWVETTRVMSEMPSVIDLSESAYVTYTAQASGINAASIVLPIINEAGEHYDIDLSLIFNGNTNFYCQSKDNDQDSVPLTCNCVSGSTLCSNTLNKRFTYTCTN